ncbi:MAG: hypothetical protein OFPI_37180 [Osedax symbiont Rs2]|nr:MAG: hypothetical protein OFPI_37180 [Osedax symbiont Rs2]
MKLTQLNYITRQHCSVAPALKNVMTRVLSFALVTTTN